MPSHLVLLTRTDPPDTPSEMVTIPIHYKDERNMGYFANTEEMYKVVRSYVASRHFKQPYLQFPKGFIQKMHG